MPRKSMVQLKADLLTSFPDNTTGLITPEIVRNYFVEVIDAIRPAYGILQRSSATSQSLTATDAAIVFDISYVSDVPDFSATPATGTLTRIEAGSTRINFNVTVEGGNGVLVTFTVYKNGSMTVWRSSTTLGGTGKPQAINISGLEYNGTSATYQMRARADGNHTVTISNMDFLLESIPVNTY